MYQVIVLGMIVGVYHSQHRAHAKARDVDGYVRYVWE